MVVSLWVGCLLLCLFEFGGLGVGLWWARKRGEGRALYILGESFNSMIGDRFLHFGGLWEGVPFYFLGGVRSFPPLLGTSSAPFLMRGEAGGGVAPSILVGTPTDLGDGCDLGEF